MSEKGGEAKTLACCNSAQTKDGKEIHAPDCWYMAAIAEVEERTEKTINRIIEIIERKGIVMTKDNQGGEVELKLKDCPFCGAGGLHPDTIRRAKAYSGIIRYPCGTKKALHDTWDGNVPRGQVDRRLLEGNYQSKDCEIVCLKKQIAEFNRANEIAEKDKRIEELEWELKTEREHSMNKGQSQ